MKKILLKNYVRFWKWNLKRTTQSAQNSFSSKLNLKFCIIFNMISFANAQGSVKIRLACSNVLLLINYFDCRYEILLRTHSYGYMKGGKYFFFIKRRQIFLFYKSRYCRCSLLIKLFITLHKKWSFPLSISLVNVTKSAVSCGFGHIYWRNP